jgi:triosephosphate isomerase
MNHGLQETHAFFSQIQKLMSSSLGSGEQSLIQSGKIQLCLIPPYLSLEKSLADSKNLPLPLSIAAQNAHWEKKGAFTGEISGPMLLELGIQSVLIGHSERRQFFGETNATVQKRTQSLLEQGFQVILCIGETREEREKNQTQEVLATQLTAAMTPAISAYLNGKLTVAYEPVWAIGTGLTATPDQAEEAHAFIRKWILEKFGKSASEQTSLLYGGSCTPENSDALFACPNVDGGLVGGASLKPEAYFSLIQSSARVISHRN